DIGNTNIVFGVHDGERWTHQWRAQTVRERMPDEYAVLFRDFFSSVGLSMEQINQAVVSSVVPRLTRGIAEMVQQQTGYAPVIVSAAVNLGIRVNTDQPERVGSDLISNAVAAYERFHSNCIVVDFGTATTFTSVIEPGEMIGVAISAGLYTTLDALVSRTAQLPHIEIAPPPSPIGRNTIHSMQSGLILGHVSMVEGMIGRIKPLLGGAKVIGTGGLSAVLGPLTDCFDMVDPWLTLDGLRLIAERNPRQ
ncbi:MAG TPA: type III pantothenate kinase, partial [Aggregatilineaceae bacterium]|nr:type III pantothenate kinase [Aggregatilineaceae bacterium]